jgi:hypothetical protein
MTPHSSRVCQYRYNFRFPSLLRVIRRSYFYQVLYSSLVFSLFSLMISAQQASSRLDMSISQAENVTHTLHENIIRLLDQAVTQAIDRRSRSVNLCLSRVSVPSVTFCQYLTQAGYQDISVRSEYIDHDRYVEDFTHISFSIPV